MEWGGGQGWEGHPWQGGHPWGGGIQPSVTRGGVEDGRDMGEFRGGGGVSIGAPGWGVCGCRGGHGCCGVSVGALLGGP